MAVRRQVDLSGDLEALRKFADEERQEAEATTPPTLSQQHLEMLESFESIASSKEAQEQYKKLPFEVSFYLTIQGLRQVAQEPYQYSTLSSWLALETWRPKDALLLLAGISPSGAVVDWSYQNFMGVEIDTPRISVATDLNAIHDQYIIPSPSDWSDDIADVKTRLRGKTPELSTESRKKLEAQLASLEALRDGPEVQRRAKQLEHRSNILAALSQMWHSGDHDVDKRYSPEHFLGWAEARGYRPEWYDWARSQDLIDDHDAVFRSPFFDPDRDDYPELLHIAVRAWQAAREDVVGTPKQRVLRYLGEKYSTLPISTRELIAQIVNWQRIGGRPRE